MAQDDERATSDNWWLYRGLSEEALAAQTQAAPSAPADAPGRTIPEPARTHLHKDHMPPWRRFEGQAKERQLGADFYVDEDVLDRVNAALLLRRPLLVTGLPGTGKTSLAHAVARELGLGPVLRWFITSRTELRDGLYQYDAIGMLQDSQRFFLDQAREGDPPQIETYLKLGPLGSAFAGFPDGDSRRDYPRVLVIDEIDKGPVDLPNDLLHIFEEGYFEIDELKRDRKDQHPIRTADADGSTVQVEHGRVQYRSFPFIVMTSNDERDFPAAFLRRCIPLEIKMPQVQQLRDIVARKLGAEAPEDYAKHRRLIDKEIIPAFAALHHDGARDLAVDQLMQVVLLRLWSIDAFKGVAPLKPGDHGPLMQALWKSLREGQE